MTLVVGVETVAADTGNPCVLLCADSRISHSSGRYAELFYPKVLRYREWVVGAAGEFRLVAAAFAELRAEVRIDSPERLALPDVSHAATDVEIADRLTLEFLPALRRCYERAGWMGKWSHDNDSTDASPDLLLGVGGYLFSIGGWDVMRHRREAIGIARQYARGALDSMAKTGRSFPKRWSSLDLQEVVEMAAARYSDVGLPSICVWTGGPGSQTIGNEGTGRGDGKVWRNGEWRDP